MKRFRLRLLEPARGKKGKQGKSSQQMQEENMTSVFMQNTAWGKVVPQDYFSIWTLTPVYNVITKG